MVCYEQEFSNLTGSINTSDFALKINVADLNHRVDKIDVGKINIIDELQGKDFVEDSYLYFKPLYKYFKTSETNINDVLSWESIGLSAEKIKPPENKISPILTFKKERIYLKIESFKLLAPEKVTYTHGSIVNLYIV